jgi:hypothetical protein
MGSARLSDVQLTYIINSYPKSVFHMLNLDFFTQLMKKHFEELHIGAVYQPSQHFSLCMVSVTLLSVHIQ